MVENRFARPLVAAPAVATRVVQLKVHDIDYSDIAADPKLATILAGLTVPTWVFTASTREHAERCLQRIGIADLPWVGIVDTRTCKLETKHSPSSFDAAMAAAGVSNPAGCLLCDDSVKNIKAAKAHGGMAEVRRALADLVEQSEEARANPSVQVRAPSHAALELRP